jgi:hypothetical protein
MTWSELTLSGSPLLVIGLRDERRRLTGYRVEVDNNVHADLRRVADGALAQLLTLERIPYTPYVGREPGEYLAIDPASLVPKPTPKKRRTGESGDEPDGPATEKEETAALVSMVRNADYLESLGAGALLEKPDDSFYVQIICFSAEGVRVGFVTKTNTRRVLKRSAIPLGKNDANDRLKKITAPEIVLEPEVHAVVGPNEIAILNKAQFQFLVSDTLLIASHVPAQVAAIASKLSAHGVKMADSTRAALQERAEASVRIARRLDAFLNRVDELDAGRVSSGAGFTASDLAPQDFINSNGEIECSPDKVVELLDALEGRFYGDPFSAEKRRADRFRRRAS